jgi:hypothetical protein
MVATENKMKLNLNAGFAETIRASTPRTAAGLGTPGTAGSSAASNGDTVAIAGAPRALAAFFLKGLQS